VAISHAKSNTIGDMTGTVTVLNSQGSTATRAATDLLRPSDWNSVHNQFLTLSGNTNNSSALSGTNIVWQGGNNITLSGVTAAGAATVVISGPNAAAVLSQSGGISNLGNTAGTSGIASGAQVRLLFAGGNNVTLSQSVNGASATVTISGAAFQSQSGGISNLGNSAGTSGIASGAAMRLLLAGGNNITLSQSVNGASATITVSAAAQSAQTIGLYMSSQTTGQSSSNTVDARSMTFVGQGNISVGMSGGSVLISQTGGGGGGAAVSIGGNSTSGVGGYSNITSGTAVIMGGPNITLSQDGRSISISANAPGGATGALTLGITNLGNSAGTSGMVSSQMVFVGGNNITLSGSVNGQSATISFVGGGGGGLVVSEYAAYPDHEWVVGQIGSNSVHVQPYPVDKEVRHSYLLLGQHFTATSNSSGSFTVSYHVGLYTLNGSTLSLLSSTSSSMGATMSGTVGSYSWYAGPRNFVIPWTNTISAGRYWLAVLSRTSASPAGMTLSQMLRTQPNSVFSGYFGQASATSRQLSAFLGIVGTTTTALPAAISSNHIIGSGSLGLRAPVAHFAISTL